MAIDIDQARRDKAELQNFLIVNNILYHYIGLGIEIAEYVIILGLDQSVDFSFVPDHINTTTIKKEVSNKIKAL